MTNILATVLNGTCVLWLIRDRNRTSTVPGTVAVAYKLETTLQVRYGRQVGIITVAIDILTGLAMEPCRPHRNRFELVPVP